MGLKIIESFDHSFSLEPEVKITLFNLLMGDSFLQQVSQQAEGSPVEFTELLFQPVPYSSSTPKGMPIEYHPYQESAEYVIINVPPNFMFTAKIFKPSRLCAIYRKKVDGV